jgi:hypothetical protein
MSSYTASVEQCGVLTWERGVKVAGVATEVVEVAVLRRAHSSGSSNCSCNGRVRWSAVLAMCEPQASTER